MVKIHICFKNVGVTIFSFFGNPENNFVGRYLPPFFPKTEIKHKIKETHLTAPLRKNALRQFANPAVVLVSASQPSSTFKSSELDVLEAATGWEDEGVWVGRPRSASC